MAQDKKQIQAVLAGRSPLHRFGQNFMIDANMVRTIADAGGLTPADTVIEIGPGTGTLTQELLARAGRVIAVEIDRDLAAALRSTYAQEPRFTLIEGDAMDGKHSLCDELGVAVRDALARGEPTKLVANLPYNIASPLVVELLLAGVKTLVFTVQKEVAQRLIAGAGSDAYGGLSVMMQLLSKVEYLRTIGPGVFWPPPDVDSALVRVTLANQLGTIDARAFADFVRKLFSFRRKTLGKSLAMMSLDSSHVPRDFDLKSRVETISPSDLLRLFGVVVQQER